jgi:predicted ATPase
MKSQIYRILDIIHKNNKIKIKKCILNEGGLNKVMSYASQEEPSIEVIQE